MHAIQCAYSLHGLHSRQCSIASSIITKMNFAHFSISNNTTFHGQSLKFIHKHTNTCCVVWHKETKFVRCFFLDFFISSDVLVLNTVTVITVDSTGKNFFVPKSGDLFLQSECSNCRQLKNAEHGAQYNTILFKWMKMPEKVWLHYERMFQNRNNGAMGRNKANG